MIDVLKYRHYTAVVSLSIFLSFIGFCIYQKQTRGQIFLYSVDFEGGTQVRLKFDKPVNTTNIRSTLEKHGWHGATTRQFSSDEILVRVKDVSIDVKSLASRISTVLAESMPGTLVDVLESELIRPSAVEALRYKALLAFLIALFAMSLYIAVRFWSFAFAMGTIVSLFHDAIVVLALFLFFDREISNSLIAAVIALLGYSINDTIVIFARIRETIAENARLKRVVSLADVVTLSINKTLSRTILMSAATSLSVASMLLFGGESLRDLSLALLVGIIFGTYSSIYIASPVMMLFHKEEGVSS